MCYITDKMSEKLGEISKLTGDLINTTQEISIGDLEKYIDAYEYSILKSEEKKERKTIARDILKVIYKQRYDKLDEEVTKMVQENL